MYLILPCFGVGGRADVIYTKNDFPFWFMNKYFSIEHVSDSNGAVNLALMRDPYPSQERV